MSDRLDDHGPAAGDPRRLFDEFAEGYAGPLAVALWLAVVHDIALARQSPRLLALMPDRTDDVDALVDTLTRRRLKSVAARRHPIGPRTFLREWICGSVAALAHTGTLAPYARWYGEVEQRAPRTLPRRTDAERVADRALRAAIAAGTVSVEELLRVPPGKGT